MLGSALRKGLTVNMLPGEKRLTFLNAGQSTASGVKVGPETAMTASAVYGAVTLTADTMASLPVRFLLEDDADRLPQAPPNLSALTGSGKVNPFQNRVDFIQTVYISMLLYGECFLYPRRNNGGDAFEIYPLDPARVSEVERLDGENGSIGLRFRIDDWNANDGWVENRPGRPAGMVHIPLHVMPGRLRGLSPVSQMAELIGMSLSSQEHASRFLGDGVHMTGTIETTGDMTPDQAKELWENFQRMHAGPKKAGRVGILTSGAQFKSVTIPPKELEFLEQMKLSDSRIHSAVYRVPPHLMGDVERSTSWGTGIEEQTNNWVKFRLLSLAKKVEAEIEATLLPPKMQMKFAMNGLLRGVAKDRAEFYRLLWNMGVLSQDDILGFEDMPPVPDGKGKQRYVPLNMAPLGEPQDAGSLNARARLAVELLAEGR